MKRIKKGDTVVVIAGRSKGQQGEVLNTLENDRCIVSSVNIVKKHQKPNPNAGITGGIVEQEAPIHNSNVMLLNPATQKGDRVGFREEGGKKVRYFKSNNELVG